MTIQQTECVLLSSLMDEPTTRPGPVACTAIAYAEWWEEPIALQVALAMQKAMNAKRPLHRAVIKQFLTTEYQPWLEHKMLNEGLPLWIAEDEAKHTMLPHYANKRLVAMIGEAYSSALDDPESARKISMDLMEKLKAIL